LVNPLARVSPPAEFENEDLINDILTELDELRPSEAGSIEPTDLQMVAESIFQAGRNRITRPGEPIRIGRQDFVGASVIIARYLETQLETYFVDDREQARQVLNDVALQRDRGWIPLAPDSTVVSLVESGFLVQRQRQQTEYSFSRPAVSEVVERWVDPTVREIRLAHELLSGLNAGWEMDERRTVPAPTLRGLSRAVDRLLFKPNEAVLLLRSAVAENEEAGLWLEVVKKNAAPLVKPLEEGGSGRSVDPRLVGLAREEDPEPGALSRMAAAGDDRVNRRTAALALTTVEGFGERLDSAVAAAFDGWDRRRRRAELWATITDADPSLRPDRQTALDRLLVTVIRAGRRLMRHAGDIGGMALAAALAAGALLGLYRALVCLLDCPRGRPGWPAGVQFGTYLSWGGLVVLLTMAAIGSGMIVGRRGPLRSAAAGTLVFGLALVAVGAVSGYTFAQLPLVVPAAFLAGVPIAVGLARRRPSLRSTVNSALITAAVWAGIQVVLASTGGLTCDIPRCERAAALPVVQSATSYANGRTVVGVVDVIWSALDAAGVGAILYCGSRIGISLRGRYRRAVQPAVLGEDP
jgi:hypothetical protein